jgi:N-acetylmuramoyl-L-alanine amidase CwlA
MIFNYKRKAKQISFRNRSSSDPLRVLYVVIHNTGNDRDSSKNNADFFATGNTRSAGAHIFIDQSGKSALSIPLKYAAYHCGGARQGYEAGSGAYYEKCTNDNSIGIELCDIMSRKPSAAMIAKTKKVIKYIRKKYPNAQTIIRHWDVTGKDCPHRFKGDANMEWKTFVNQIS